MTDDEGWWSGQRPVILLGMHRSGTSLMSRILRGFGIEMGRATDNSDESLYFQLINRWLLRELPGGWEYPLPARAALDNPEAVNELSTAVRRQLGSSWPATHFFPRRRPTRPDNWGWKDPRTTITMPVWANVFPDYRAIWVVRNGAAVAASLLTRRENSRDAPSGSRRRVTRALLGPARPGPSLHLRCRTLDGAFGIWEDYHQIMDEHPQPERVHTVRYEELLATPDQVLAPMLEFLGLSDSPDVSAGLDNARALVEPQLATAFRSRPAARRLQEEKASELAARGYPAER